MGCGQSKIIFYRRNKNKGNSKDSTDADSLTPADEDADITRLTSADAEADVRLDEAVDSSDPSEEEEGSPEEVGELTDPEDHHLDNRQHVLPISEHQPTFEVSINQQMFFKMLDEKIEQGKDYDSTSETEMLEEEERKRNLIERWNSYLESKQSSISQASPSTPTSGSRLTRSVYKISERQCAPSTSRQCYRQESSPTWRSHGVQTHDPRPSTSNEWDTDKSPITRTQSASPSWWNNPKVAPMPKPKKDEPGAGCSKDSQITYNPTFQNHSPAHASKTQPYITQIVSHSSPTKCIAPPKEYQDSDITTVERQVTITQKQSQIYYIQGSNATIGTAPDKVQQRQQTAIKLQQYVAMKQAQQQIFTSYMQRTSQAVFPGGDFPATHRMQEGEELAAQYGYPVLDSETASSRGNHADDAHMNTPMCDPLPPGMTTQWAGGQVPPEMEYYPQSHFVPMFRANSAGSAGTLTRYHKKENTEKTVQSISVVRGKPVGQIVAVGGQELAVSNVSDSPSPASVSTDSGVSPGTSAPSSKSSTTGTPTTTANETFDPKPNKNKSSTNRTIKLSKSLDV